MLQDGPGRFREAHLARLLELPVVQHRPHRVLGGTLLEPDSVVCDSGAVAQELVYGREAVAVLALVVSLGPPQVAQDTSRDRLARDPELRPDLHVGVVPGTDLLEHELDERDERVAVHESEDVLGHERARRPRPVFDVLDHEGCDVGHHARHERDEGSVGGAVAFPIQLEVMAEPLHPEGGVRPGPVVAIAGVIGGLDELRERGLVDLTGLVALVGGRDRRVELAEAHDALLRNGRGGVSGGRRGRSVEIDEIQSHRNSRFSPEW